MTNMTAEVGGFTGYVAPDGKTVEYLVAYRGMPRGEAERLCAGLASDAGAEYCEVIEIDAAAIRPMMALPGDPGNGQYIDAAARRVENAGRSDHQRDQPKLSRPLGSGAALPRQPVQRRGVCHHRLHHRVAARDGAGSCRVNSPA